MSKKKYVVVQDARQDDGVLFLSKDPSYNWTRRLSAAKKFTKLQATEITNKLKYNNPRPMKVSTAKKLLTNKSSLEYPDEDLSWDSHKGFF